MSTSHRKAQVSILFEKLFQLSFCGASLFYPSLQINSILIIFNKVRHIYQLYLCNRFQPAPVQVLLSEEITGSIRKLKVERDLYNILITLTRFF